MVKRNKVTVRHSAEMAAMHQKAGRKVIDVCRSFPQYSIASVYRHANKKIGEEAPLNLRTRNRGRPSKFSQQDRRAILRAIPKLRQAVGSFTSPRVALEAGVADKVSNRSVRRVLNANGYRYCRSRKKGLLKPEDLKARISFCKEIRRRKLDQNFWNQQISFYLDGKGFQYKRNPFDQARAPTAREWRKPSEGLKLGCTAKGQKEGAVNCNFMVGISYNNGVNMCEQYFGPITGEKMSSIVVNSFPNAFESSINPQVKRILMDGCPRQNSRKSLNAIEEVGGMVFKIPPRPPDLNPIENFFSMVTKELKKQALEERITNETREEFSQRVKETMLCFPVEKVNKLIESMDNRVRLVLKAKGMRIKY